MGLPTAAVIAAAGFPVVGVDIRSAVVRQIRFGKLVTAEPGLCESLRYLCDTGKLSVSTNLASGMKRASIVFICVQTPVSSQNSPNLSFLKRAVSNVAVNLRKGMLVVVGSTVPPGTTARIVAPLLERLSGLKVGVNFWLAHCPERISPGAALRTTIERTRLVGGIDSESSRLAAAFLRALGTRRVVEGEIGAVEVAKTAENTFRNVNIALANVLALICEEAGVDVYEAIELANTHERVSLHQPGAGVGGPCLQKDPYLLMAPIGTERVSAKLIQDSLDLNDSMPVHVVKLVVRNLLELGIDVNSSLIGVLGVTFRGGTDDTRNSPAEKIIVALQRRKARVTSFDPLSAETFGSERSKDARTVLLRAQCVVFATDHPEFRGLPIPSKSRVRLIVDGRRVLDPAKVPRNIRYVAVGDLTHARR